MIEGAGSFSVDILALYHSSNIFQFIDSAMWSNSFLWCSTDCWSLENEQKFQRNFILVWSVSELPELPIIIWIKMNKCKHERVSIHLKDGPSTLLQNLWYFDVVPLCIVLNLELFEILMSYLLQWKVVLQANQSIWVDLRYRPSNERVLLLLSKWATLDRWLLEPTLNFHHKSSVTSFHPSLLLSLHSTSPNPLQQVHINMQQLKVNELQQKHKSKDGYVVLWY